MSANGGGGKISKMVLLCGPVIYGTEQGKLVTPKKKNVAVFRATDF